MFRGVHYVTVDYMVYVQDGCITFAYWKPQFVKESIDKKHAKSDSILAIFNFRSELSIKIVSGTNSDGRQRKKTARLNIYFGNFQLHYFNSWKLDESLFTQKKNSQYSSSSDSQSQLNFSSNCVNSFFNYISKKFKRNEPPPESTEFRSNIDDYNSDNDMTEDLMQLFSVVNIKIEKVFNFGRKKFWLIFFLIFY